MTLPLAYDPAQVAVAREVLAALGAAPNRTLGQNFLVNASALDHICEVASLQKTDAVLEIGPGLGALTVRLKRDAHSVTAIEKDRAFAAFIRNKFRGEGFFLVEDDALDVEWNDLKLPETGVKIVANLPYSISKPMLRRIYEDWRPHLHSATVLLQREVANRLVATAGAKEYGPLAIMASLYSRTEKAFDIAPGSFLPPPDVVSTVVHAVFLEKPSIALHDEKKFWQIVRAAFGQRRKTLGNTLKVIAPRDVLAPVFEKTNIDPQRRGETLSPLEFNALCEAIFP